MESPHSNTPSSRMTQRTPRYRETPSLVWISPRWESSHGGSGSTNGGWLEPLCRWAFLLWLNSLEPEDDGSTQVQGIKGISSFSGKNPFWVFFFRRWSWIGSVDRLEAQDGCIWASQGKSSTDFEWFFFGKNLNVHGQHKMQRGSSYFLCSKDASSLAVSYYATSKLSKIQIKASMLCISGVAAFPNSECKVLLVKCSSENRWC